MKTLVITVIVLLFSACAFANSISVTGSVSVVGSGGNCSASGSAAGSSGVSLHLLCPSPAYLGGGGSSQVDVDASLLGGSFYEHSQGYYGDLAELTSAYSAHLTMDGTYVVTGGVGTTQVGFYANWGKDFPDGAFQVPSCTLTLAGNSVPCPTGMNNDSPVMFSVTYGQPFDVSLDVSATMSFYTTNGPYDILQYGFSSPNGSLSVAPEPATFLLVIPALACIGGMVRKKLRAGGPPFKQ